MIIAVFGSSPRECFDTLGKMLENELGESTALVFAVTHKPTVIKIGNDYMVMVSTEFLETEYLLIPESSTMLWPIKNCQLRPESRPHKKNVPFLRNRRNQLMRGGRAPTCVRNPSGGRRSYHR